MCPCESWTQVQVFVYCEKHRCAVGIFKSWLRDRTGKGEGVLKNHLREQLSLWDYSMLISHQIIQLLTTATPPWTIQISPLTAKRRRLGTLGPGAFSTWMGDTLTAAWSSNNSVIMPECREEFPRLCPCSLSLRQESEKRWKTRHTVPLEQVNWLEFTHCFTWFTARPPLVNLRTSSVLRR